MLKSGSRVFTKVEGHRGFQPGVIISVIGDEAIIDIPTMKIAVQSPVKDLKPMPRHRKVKADQPPRITNPLINGTDYKTTDAPASRIAANGNGNGNDNTVTPDEIQYAIRDIFGDPNMDRNWSEVKERLYTLFPGAKNKKVIDEQLATQYRRVGAGMKEAADSYSVLRPIALALGKIDTWSKYDLPETLRNEIDEVKDLLQSVLDMMDAEMKGASQKQAAEASSIDYAAIPKKIPVEVVDDTMSHFKDIHKGRPAKPGTKKAIRAFMMKEYELDDNDDLKAAVEHIHRALAGIERGAADIASTSGLTIQLEDFDTGWSFKVWDHDLNNYIISVGGFDNREDALESGEKQIELLADELVELKQKFQSSKGASQNDANDVSVTRNEARMKTASLAERLDGARFVKYDPATGLLHVWFGSNSRINVFDESGQEVDTYSTFARILNSPEAAADFIEEHMGDEGMEDEASMRGARMKKRAAYEWAVQTDRDDLELLDVVDQGGNPLSAEEIQDYIKEWPDETLYVAGVSAGNFSVHVAVLGAMDEMDAISAAVEARPAHFGASPDDYDESDLIPVDATGGYADPNVMVDAYKISDLKPTGRSIGGSKRTAGLRPDFSNMSDEEIDQVLNQMKERKISSDDGIMANRFLELSGTVDEAIGRAEKSGPGFDKAKQAIELFDELGIIKEGSKRTADIGGFWKKRLEDKYKAKQKATPPPIPAQAPAQAPAKPQISQSEVSDQLQDIVEQSGSLDEAKDLTADWARNLGVGIDTMVRFVTDLWNSAQGGVPAYARVAKRIVAYVTIRKRGTRKRVAADEDDGMGEVFQQLAQMLQNAGIDASAKFFDQYQGWYLNVPGVDNYWAEDFYSRGKQKGTPGRYIDSYLMDEEGNKTSANPGDYFMMNPDDVFEGMTLVLKTRDGETQTIENPKKSDLPSDVDKTIQFEEGTVTDTLVLRGEKDEGFEIEIQNNKVIDDGGLVENIKYLKQSGASRKRPEQTQPITRSEAQALSASLAKTMEMKDQYEIHLPVSKVAKMKSVISGTRECPAIDVTGHYKVAVKQGVCELCDSCNVVCVFGG